MVGGERRDVIDSARGKGSVLEGRDVTDSARGKGFVNERRDVSDSATGKGVGGEKPDVIDARGCSEETLCYRQCKGERCCSGET